MRTVWYKRSGVRTTRKAVQSAKDQYALGKRLGAIGSLRCSVQPTVADCIDKMTLDQFATWTGQFTYRKQGDSQ
jgi:hypothetical protein